MRTRLHRRWLVFGAGAFAVFLASCSTSSGAVNADTAYERCVAGGSDARVLETCRDLERALQPEAASVRTSMDAISNRQRVSTDAFLQVVVYCRRERVATTSAARVYARLGQERYGRAYAIQAIGWSFYDAKNSADVIVAARDEHVEYAKPLLNENVASLREDQSLVAEMERLYPHSLDEAIAHMRMKRSDYDEITTRIYAVTPK